jgi:5'(3')-deoxyribonucleotidase
MNKFYDIFIDMEYIKNLKLLPSFKNLAKELLLLQDKHNVFFYITSTTRSNKEIVQRSRWLNSIVLPIDYGTYFSNYKKNKSNINSSCILIDSDINNCLLFEEQGSYSILYNNNPQDCIDKLEAIIKEHF